MFQRRRDGSENFYRGWTEYENGFGNVKGEHWLGLKKISYLTVLTVRYTTKEPGGTMAVICQTSMDCTLMVGVMVMASHGTILMLLLQVGTHFTIQT